MMLLASPLRAVLLSTPHAHAGALRLYLRLLAAGLQPSATEAAINGLLGKGMESPFETDQSVLLHRLAARRQIEFRSADDGFAMRTISAQFRLDTPPIESAKLLRLSKFTMIVPDEGAMTVIDPLSDRWFVLNDPTLAATIARFSQPLAPQELAVEAQVLVSMMVAGGMLLPCDSDGLTEDDRDLARRMWEPHDLLMHTRSRFGRTRHAIGGVHEFRGKLEYEDALAEPLPVLGWINLPRPADDLVTPSLKEAIEQRRSTRQFSKEPVTLDQLGALLHLAFAWREDGRANYPSGGGLYEQVLYIAVEGSVVLECGLYRYDSIKHTLGKLDVDEEGVLRMLDHAAISSKQEARPPMLLMIASRFARARWRYAGLAYALQLKHVGVTQEILYLVTTALGLGGCAIGTGDSDLFATVTGLDYLREGSIGEFMLGVPRRES